VNCVRDLSGCATQRRLVWVQPFLFIILETSRLNTLPLLADLYAQQVVEASAQFAVMDRLHTGLTAAIRLMMGLWLLATSAALKQEQRTLADLSLLAGVVNLVGTFFAPAAGLNLLLFPIWFFSLARWRFKAGGEDTNRSTVALQER
jgi:hypothetical protein